LTEFLSLEYLKNSLSINDDDSDSKLLEIITDANIETDKVILPYAETIPVDTNTELFQRGTLLSAMYARARWYRDNFQQEMAESAQTEYENKKQSLIEVLQAERTSRTKPVLVTSDPRDKKLLLPSQKDTFVLDDY